MWLAKVPAVLPEAVRARRFKEACASLSFPVTFFSGHRNDRHVCPSRSDRCTDGRTKLANVRSCVQRRAIGSSLEPKSRPRHKMLRHRNHIPGPSEGNRAAAIDQTQGLFCFLSRCPFPCVPMISSSRAVRAASIVLAEDQTPTL